ncbi:MAG: hypothetical protein OEY04_12280, partial [Gammaproteobacteria bacterium]|nr:hypothetical protein [Gammaproteobacteria bacterium]
MTITAVVSVFAITSVSAAETRNLAAPVYPGAVAAVPAEGAEAAAIYIGTFGDIKTLDCQGRRSSTDFAGRPISNEEAANANLQVGPWCFLARDPIDKVKAFYDKSIGAMRPLQGEDGKHGFQVYAERAWFRGGDESGPGFGYSGVSVHALAPPRIKDQTAPPATYGDEKFEGQDDYAFYAQSGHFGMFVEAVDWFGDPSKRRPTELDTVYKKYNYLESAFFQRKGPELTSVGETLRKHYQELQAQRMQAAMMAPVSARQQLAATAQPAPAGESAEDAEFNRIMRKNPELANRYMSLTQQVGVLMQQGKFDEADE